MLTHSMSQKTDLKNLSRILTCLHLGSGLKINFNKSKIYGIGVTNLELTSLASSIGCQPSHLPFTYLGLPIGANMSRFSNWSPLVERFLKRLKTFTVKGIRSFLVNTYPRLAVETTRWNNLVPIKVNISSWRIANKRIPTRINLDNQGIDLNSLRCPLCDDDLETKEHILVLCCVAKNT
ncbi:reverse transcriptase domain, Zinc finger, CCHC-type [Artemisia annua]|uniref:Reverse transcriptase domain, Zinc finger, CCHC-type n=1 Tax=Artemisia annua TaxID=35608 RepID=A0A2U1MJK5_ARTAN|nr:reverse transcriptase domain, Zinc finger, CCHC-type [Artemisia annua]